MVNSETTERPNSVDNERVIKENISKLASKALDQVLRNKEHFRSYLASVGYIPKSDSLPEILDTGKLSMQSLNLPL